MEGGGDDNLLIMRSCLKILKSISLEMESSSPHLPHFRHLRIIIKKGKKEEDDDDAV